MKQRHEFELVIDQKRENALHSQINSLNHLTGKQNHSTLLTHNNSLHTGHLHKQKKLNNEGPDVHSLDALMPTEQASLHYASLGRPLCSVPITPYITRGSRLSIVVLKARSTWF